MASVLPLHGKFKRRKSANIDRFYFLGLQNNWGFYFQMKEQDRNPQDQINIEQIEKLSEKEFRVIIVKMIQKSQKLNGENARNI